MTLLRSLAMAFSTFSRIPVPQVSWEERSMRYLMAFFPLIGAVIALLLWLWYFICDLLLFDMTLRAAGVTLIPVLVTGAIHLDGFCDVVDALSSHAEPERRREILKDPHIGAFAAVAVAAYLLAFFAFAMNLTGLAEGTLLVLVGCIFVVSRCMSSLATTCFPLSATKGMLSKFHESAETKRVVAAVIVELVVVAAVMVWAQPLCALVELVCAFVVLACVRQMSRYSFGGMSGDIAGFLLQVAELCMLAGLVVTVKVMMLL
ncbi:MAG: adenosylcobinamide-GDP ribazoletransferase [Coriobacteriales bacterium]